MARVKHNNTLPSPPCRLLSFLHCINAALNQQQQLCLLPQPVPPNPHQGYNHQNSAQDITGDISSHTHTDRCKKTFK